MNCPKLTGIPVAVVVLLASMPTYAVEALSSAELAMHCEKYHDENAGEDREFCVRYIQGFIDGAVVTDERVTLNVAKEYEAQETFAQRAARTRIGARLERYGSSVYADYCLGDPVPLREVVEHVVAAIGDPALVAAHPLARDVVYRTLWSEYPCQIVD